MIDWLRIERIYITPDVHLYGEVVWERRDVVMTNWRDGSVNFEQRGVEFPDFWSVNAVNIVTSRYFRGAVGTLQREIALTELIDCTLTFCATCGTAWLYEPGPTSSGCIAPAAQKLWSPVSSDTWWARMLGVASLRRPHRVVRLVGADFLSPAQDAHLGLKGGRHMAPESDPVGHCARCERRSRRQALVDWAPVIGQIVWKLLQSFWS